jgi:hypothetical protein
MTWKAGDWVTFDRAVGQIKEIRDGGYASFSDGHFETSGRLLDRFRPLTLRNKSIVETFEIIYRRLDDLPGNAGFNYPDISSHFSNLALQAIDAKDNAKMFDMAQEFVREARDYKPVIQGIGLFRPNPKARAV